MRNYIDEKYIIITNKANVTKIKDICSHARVIHLEPGAIRVSDFMGINKFLIDVKAVSEEFINEMKSNPVNKIVEWRTVKQSLKMLGIEDTLDAMDLVFRMGNLALETIENDKQVEKSDELYGQMSQIIKQAYKDMYETYKGYYHE